LFLARGLLQENASSEEIFDLTRQGLALARNPEYKAMGYYMLADIYTKKNQPKQVQQALAKASQFKAEIR